MYLIRRTCVEGGVAWPRGWRNHTSAANNAVCTWERSRSMHVYILCMYTALVSVCTCYIMDCGQTTQEQLTMQLVWTNHTSAANNAASVDKAHKCS